MSIIETEFTCRLCRQALSKGANTNFYDCNNCKRSYSLIPSRGGLCEKLPFEECRIEIQKLEERFPQTDPETLAQIFYDGNNCVRVSDLGLQTYIIEMRRLFYISKTESVDMSPESIKFFQAFTDCLERLRKAPPKRSNLSQGNDSH